MSTKSLLLHIGTPKTGTTSIQDCLAQAEAQGALLPYRYPLWRGERNQWRLLWLYQTLEEMPKHLRSGYRENTRRRYRKFLFEQLREAPGALLSWEGLSRHLSPGSVSALRKDLESLGFNDFHVLMYVRDPADFYLSRTQEVMRLYGVLPEDPASFRYEFRRIAHTWEQVFPGELIVRRYPCGAHDDVLSDFSHQVQDRLGINAQFSSMRMNSGLSAEAMVIVQDYLRALRSDDGALPIPGLSRIVSFLRRPSEFPTQTRPVLKASVAELIRANHQEDAEFLYTRYGVDLGLRDTRPATRRPANRGCSVEEILESVNDDTVHELLLRLARNELSRRESASSLPLRVAARAYRAIPAQRRPQRLDALLRSALTRGSQA